MGTLTNSSLSIAFKSARYKALFALNCFFLLAVLPAWTQSANETLLSDQNAYNPIPSPDGKLIAYVSTGWGRLQNEITLGRAELVSEVNVMTADGKPLTTHSLADAFLAGWTPDGKALICYRDWSYRLVTLSGASRLDGRLPGPDDMPKLATSTPWVFKTLNPTERVFYLASFETFGWIEPSADLKTDTDSNTLIETQKGVVAQHPGWLGDTVVPSPDGRYLAIFDPVFQEDLWVYDTESTKWFDLGPVTVYPDREWDYMKPAWNPWFPDSSHLVYISGSHLVVSEPDGVARREIRIDDPAGLPAASPDGKFIAYVTFESRPRKARPDLKFWGATVIWVLPGASMTNPIAVTSKNSDTTYDLRWLDNNSVVFDRLEDEPFPQHARLWKASVAATK